MILSAKGELAIPDSSPSECHALECDSIVQVTLTSISTHPLTPFIHMDPGFHSYPRTHASILLWTHTHYTHVCPHTLKGISLPGEGAGAIRLTGWDLRRGHHGRHYRKMWHRSLTLGTESGKVNPWFCGSHQQEELIVTGMGVKTRKSPFFGEV